MATHDIDQWCSAGLRHIRDAQNLLNWNDHESPDQAWHLSGVALECLEKACIAQSWLHRALGHTAEPDSEVLVSFAISMDPRAARLGVDERRPEVFDGWSISSRYDSTGTTPMEVARRAVSAAAERVHDLSCALWASGALRGERL